MHLTPRAHFLRTGIILDSIFAGLLDFVGHGLLHASAWQEVIFTLVVTHITIAAVTIFLHRCQAHRALDLHAIPSHFFRFWLWMTTGMVTKEWAAIHRKHHAKCETPEDPHSPVTRGIKTVLLTGAELYRAESKNAETMQKYGHGTPDDWMERNVYSKYSALGVSLMVIIDVLMFGAAGMTIWAIQMLWIPITAAGIINGVGHYWGYRNFECSDASTNIVPWGILIGGEELHNNHHTFGTSAKLSNKWFEFDIGWMYIRILESMGLATVKKVAPSPKFDREKVVADLETLQSVIANRYDVMAKYAKSLKQAWSEELERVGSSNKVENSVLRNAKALLKQEPAKIDAPRQQQMSELFAHSKALTTIHEMRLELASIWERSHASREQLLKQLQDWCTRAEASGIQALHDFSLRLRSYA